MIGTDHLWLRQMICDFGLAVVEPPSRQLLRHYGSRMGVSNGVNWMSRYLTIFRLIKQDQYESMHDQVLHRMIMKLSEPRMHMARWKDMADLFRSLGTITGNAVVDMRSAGLSLAEPAMVTSSLLLHAANSLCTGAPWLFSYDDAGAIDKAMTEDESGYVREWYRLARLLVGEGETS